jgi:catechol 2,3-dioxygenase-like lactoylglutathione lyase family enzyme
LRQPAFNHVSVTCSDFDRSLAFYTELIGLPLLSQAEISSTTIPELSEIIGLGQVELRFAEIDLGAGAWLELFEYVDPRGEPVGSRTCDHGSVHFCLTLDQEIDEMYERLMSAGVTCRSAPVELATGPWKGARVFYSLDPDGVTVELVQFAPSDPAAAAVRGVTPEHEAPLQS